MTPRFRLYVQLMGDENEHVNFIQKLEAIIEDIKGGAEKGEFHEKNIIGNWSVDPINQYVK